MVVAEDLKPHVAFLPTPGMGHVIPVLELAKRLATNHGISVSFLLIATYASLAQTLFFQSPTIPPEIKIVNIPPVDISGIVDEITPVLSRLCVAVQESLKQIRSILVDINPTALVIDLFTSQAIDVAKQLSIPVYTFCTSSASFLAFALYLPTLDREVEGEYFLERIKVPGCRTERIEDLVVDPVRNRKTDDYKWCPFHLSRLTLVDGILENSWEDLEPLSLKAMREHDFYKSIMTPPVYPVGPIIKADEFISTKQNAKIMKWLDNQPADSVLFVAFGSGGTLTSEQLTELAWGLEMSEQRFILVARKPSDFSASSAYFSLGNNENDPSLYLPEGFLKRTEGSGVIVPSWAPQAAILGHAVNGGLFDTLRLELNTGKFISWCANPGLAIICGAEDERDPSG